MMPTLPPTRYLSPISDANSRYGDMCLKFEHIYEGMMAYDDYFKPKKDVIGCFRLSGYQKCMIAMRMLVYGTSAN